MMDDGELIKFATDFRKGILGRRSSLMMCDAVCLPLVPLLNMSGIECEAAWTEWIKLEHGQVCNHVWIRLADGRALDPTSDQFNKLMGLAMPKVYLGEPVARIHDVTLTVANAK